MQGSALALPQNILTSSTSVPVNLLFMDHAIQFGDLFKLEVDIVCLDMAHVTWVCLTSKASLALWHCCLSHVSEDTIQSMVNANAITSIEVVGGSSGDCSACHKGKQTWNLIPQVTQDRAMEVLGQIFSDICGPIDTPTKGYCYSITFTNDFSHYTHVGLTKSKDEALNVFKIWKTHTEKETSKSLKILCMDGGGEYTSMAFSQYLAENGIKPELTNAYTLQENSVSKHANHTLNNLA